MMERGLLVYTGTIVGSGVVIGTCLEGGCAVIGRLLFKAKPPLSTGKVVKIVKWGIQRDAIAGTEARIAQLTSKEIEIMKQEGLTLSDVYKFRGVYSRAIFDGIGGAVAPGRLELMKLIIKMW